VGAVGFSADAATAAASWDFGGANWTGGGGNGAAGAGAGFGTVAVIGAF
jgi:hypothetical protein